MAKLSSNGKELGRLVVRFTNDEGSIITRTYSAREKGLLAKTDVLRDGLHIPGRWRVRIKEKSLRAVSGDCIPRYPNGVLSLLDELERGARAVGRTIVKRTGGAS